MILLHVGSSSQLYRTYVYGILRYVMAHLVLNTVRAILEDFQEKTNFITSRYCKTLHSITVVRADFLPWPVYCLRSRMTRRNLSPRLQSVYCTRIHPLCKSVRDGHGGLYTQPSRPAQWGPIVRVRGLSIQTRVSY